MEKTIYISGQITGIELSEAKRNFKNAQELLIPYYAVMNPMEIVPYQEGKRWLDYMIDDLKLLRMCDAIYMLTGWENSAGAMIEHRCALREGIKVVYEQTL